MYLGSGDNCGRKYYLILANFFIQLFIENLTVPVEVSRFSIYGYSERLNLSNLRRFCEKLDHKYVIVSIIL